MSDSEAEDDPSARVHQFHQHYVTQLLGGTF